MGGRSLGALIFHQGAGCCCEWNPLVGQINWFESWHAAGAQHTPALSTNSRSSGSHHPCSWWTEVHPPMHPTNRSQCLLDARPCTRQWDGDVNLMEFPAPRELPSYWRRQNSQDKHKNQEMLDLNQFYGRKQSRKEGWGGRGFHFKFGGMEVKLEQSLEGGEGESHAHVRAQVSRIR